MPTEKRKRPFGVTIMVILTIASVLATILPLLAVPNLPFFSELERVIAVTPSDLINAMLAPFQLVLAFGLWYLKRWAWVWYMIQLGISMIVALQAHFSGQADVHYFLMALYVLVVFYLNQRDVQHAFGHNQPIRERVTA